jgi:hypothetical protein
MQFSAISLATIAAALLTSCICLLTKRDYVLKSAALFYVLFVVFVALSEYLTNLPFTLRVFFSSEQLSTAITLVSLFILFFIVTAYPVQPLYFDNEVANQRVNIVVVLTMAAPALAFLIYYALNFGYRLDGSFVLNKSDRSSTDYYIYAYVISLYVATQYNRTIAVTLILFAVVYLLAGERMKSYMYLTPLLLVSIRLSNRSIFSLIYLIMGFAAAEVVSLMRSGLDLQSHNDKVNISHFGEVTVSSLYLLNMIDLYTPIQRAQFGLGIILANLIPAELLPPSFDIRKDLVSSFNIPGGGWLPVYIYAAAGYFGVLLLSVGLALTYRAAVHQSTRRTLSHHWRLAWQAYILIFASTLPNWLMYTPYQIIKLPLYSFILTVTLGLVFRRLIPQDMTIPANRIRSLLFNR